MTSPRTILVRYDEIGLKGKNRSMFIDQLVANIRFQLKDLEGIEVRRPHGRVLVHCDQGQIEECLKHMKRVAGIASMSPGIEVEPDFEMMAKCGIQWIEPVLKKTQGLKFCVRTRRANKQFPKTSTEVDFEVGSRIMRALHSQGLVVDINRAEFVLEIEIGQDQTIVFNNRVPGLSGLPVGSSGNVLGLISGGIDSPVALFQVMRRGCRVHGIFFDNQPYMGRGGYDKVLRLGRLLNRYQGKGRLFVVPFETIQEAIRDHCRPAHRVVLYRRMMYRIAETLALRIGCKGLVTGESLGQVASQTLENLNAVSCIVSLSVLRPLIGMHKGEIIQMAKELESFDISIIPQPDCCSVFMPPNPATRAKVDDLEADEAKYPWEDLMQAAMDQIETIHLDDLEG